jgi:hypothetical protein
MSVPFDTGSGRTLHYRFQTRKKDIGFSIRMRRMGKGGAEEVEIEPMTRVPADEEPVGGSQQVEQDCKLVLVFDNTFSFFTAKDVDYKVYIA